MNSTNKPRLWVWPCLLSLLVCSLQAQNDRPGSSAGASAVPRSNLRLSDDAGGTSLILDGKSVGTLKQIKSSGPLTVGKIVFSLAGDGQSLAVQGRGTEVVIEADQFAGWAAKVPDSNQLSLLLKGTTGEMELAVPTANTAPVTLRFSDGGAAEMTPNSMGHLDVFKDKSYYFSGYGRVNVNSADGEGYVLTYLRPPLMGGPLAQTADEKGTNRFKRLTPLTEVRFSSGMEKELSIDVGGSEKGAQVVKLARGETRKVTMSNGSVIEFSLNPSSHMVDWRVEKGVFRISIDGIDCWRALGLTGQKAGQQWDSASQAVDLSNNTQGTVPKPNQSLYTSFSKSVSAAVSPQALLQYSPVEPCRTYHVSAQGGSVVLFDAETGKQFAVTSKNLLIRLGSDVAGAGLPIGANRAVALAWDAGSSLEVSGVLGQTSIDRNSKTTLEQPGGGGKVDVIYSEAGQLTLTAREGDFLLQPKSLINWGIELHQGDSLTLDLDTRRGTFTLRTSQENVSNVKISTGDGFQPVMYPDSVLTFILGRAGSMVSSSQGNLVFFEAAGAGGDSTSIAPSFTPTPSASYAPPPFGFVSGQIDVSRIQQSPASVVTPGP